MKIIWLFFMTMVFGIISMITSKKYNLKGELKELRFPTAFSKILYGCFIISMICAIVIMCLYQDIAITVLFLIMAIISALTAWAISKYRIIIEESKIVVIYPFKKKRSVPFSNVEYVEKKESGGYRVVITGEKNITMDAMLVGIDDFIEHLKNKSIQLKNM